MNLADPDLLRDFLTEAGEMLEGLDVKLVDLESRPNDKDLLNDIFRGFHTIKGGGGFLEATALVELCHRAENLLDRLRNGSLTLNPEMLDVILAATGEVKRMFVQMEGQRDPELSDPGLLEQIEAILDGRTAAAAVQADAPEPAKSDPVNPGAPSDDTQWWSSLLQGLVGGIAAPLAIGPAAPSPEPSSAPSPMKGQAPKAAVAAGSHKETTLRIDVSRFDQILNLSGEIGLTKNRLTHLRTDIVDKYRNDDSLKVLDSVVDQLDMLVSDLQNAVMKARMQPVGRVFQKYVRLARDLARQLGKDVELVLEGEDTEVDKNMIEELNDPLVHLVRNAVDHGVETIEERTAVGKPGRAVVRLSARQAGDAIIIEITDDGHGMKPEVLRQKAIEKGTITAEEAATLDDRHALELIFRPGFSTKSVISDTSGRGVGMDVVMTNIKKLSGRIDLQSEPGKGTRVTITLPLTLAILPVLVVGVQGQPYAVPLATVREVISVAPESTQLVAGKPAINVRGEVLPLLNLAKLLGKTGEGTGLVGVVATSGDQTFILAVDHLHGQDEVVIKPLAGFKPKGVAGATVSSEGVLVLVLDMRELLEAS